MSVAFQKSPICYEAENDCAHTAIEISPHEETDEHVKVDTWIVLEILFTMGSFCEQCSADE